MKFAGRRVAAFHGGDFSPAARTVIVNKAFERGFVQRGIAPPLSARLRYSSDSGVSAAEPPFEIVGVVLMQRRHGTFARRTLTSTGRGERLRGTVRSNLMFSS